MLAILLDIFADGCLAFVLKAIVFMIDRLHSRNHTACSCGLHLRSFQQVRLVFVLLMPRLVSSDLTRELSVHSAAVGRA